MIYYYSLRIDTSVEQFDLLNTILGVKSNFPISSGWGLEVIQKKEDNPIFFIDYFLSILEAKYEELERIGIHREDLSIWMLYSYKEQCNMEFSPKDMYRLGKEGIALCVSCWEE